MKNKTITISAATLNVPTPGYPGYVQSLLVPKVISGPGISTYTDNYTPSIVEIVNTSGVALDWNLVYSPTELEELKQDWDPGPAQFYEFLTIANGATLKLPLYGNTLGQVHALVLKPQAAAGSNTLIRLIQLTKK